MRLIVHDFLAADIEAHQSSPPVDLPDEARCQKDLVAGSPLAGVDPDIANDPVGIIHEEFLDMTDQAVEQMDTMSDDGFNAAKMGIVG